MSVPATVGIAETPVGSTVDVAVTLVAPTEPGTYTGYWQLRNAAGVFFGTPFLVRVVVASVSEEASVSGDASVSEVMIAFSADRTEVVSGECVTLQWNVDNVKAVYLDEGGVDGHDSRSVCPATTTTYTLRVERLDGTTEVRQVTIVVWVPPAQVEPGEPGTGGGVRPSQ